MRTWRPSERIKDVLMGKVAMEDEAPAIRSACSKHIYDGANSILRLPSKDARKKALERVPDLIRPYLEREILRLYKARK